MAQAASQYCRQGLGGHRGPGGSRHSHPEAKDKDQVQGDVQKGRGGEEEEGGAAIPQGPKDAGEKVIQHGGGDAPKDDDNIEIGVREDIRRGVHKGQHRGGGKDGGGGEKKGDSSREKDGPRRRSAHPPVVPGAEVLGHRDGKTAANPGNKSQHQKAQGAGGAHPRQGGDPHKPPHDEGIRHAVELLEQAPQHQGAAKKEYHLQRLSPCHIFDQENRFLFVEIC